MSSYIKEKKIKIIYPNNAFLPANSKLRQISKFANKCLQTEFVNTYCTMPEPRVKFVIANCNTPIFSDAYGINDRKTISYLSWAVGIFLYKTHFVCKNQVFN